MTDVQPQVAFLAWPSWLSHGRQPAGSGTLGARGKSVHPPGCPTEAQGMASSQKKHERLRQPPAPSRLSGSHTLSLDLGHSVLGRPHAACRLPLLWSWGSVCMAQSCRRGACTQEAAVLAQERAHGPEGIATQAQAGQRSLRSVSLAHRCCRSPQSTVVSHASPSGPGTRELSLEGRAWSELRAH